MGLPLGGCPRLEARLWSSVQKHPLTTRFLGGSAGSEKETCLSLAVVREGFHS